MVKGTERNGEGLYRRVVQRALFDVHSLIASFISVSFQNADSDSILEALGSPQALL